jgi:threonine dehydrogenase-like Zn-dependent dehydrogenase
VRAVVLRDGKLEVRSTADPKPGPGELLLKTLSTAICASDVRFMDHPELGVKDPTGRSLYDADRDIVMGHEFVGEVVGHGPGCTEELPVGTPRHSDADAVGGRRDRRSAHHRTAP